MTGAHTMPARTFWQRIELMQRCVGESRMTNTPVDLSGVLGDARALQELVDDLWFPFAHLHVDAVVALHEQETNSDGEVHHVTAAIAGAVASARHLAMSEATVLPVPQRIEALAHPTKSKRHRTAAVKSSTKRRTSLLPPVATATTVHSNPDFVCRRVVCVDVGEKCVELKQQTLCAGHKVLLVLDWVDSIDAIVAARAALAHVGVDVVGVSVVVATTASIAQQLKAAQLLFHCAWTPRVGAADVASRGSCKKRQEAVSITRSIVPTGDRVAVSADCACHRPRRHRLQSSSSVRKRRRSSDDCSDPSDPSDPSDSDRSSVADGNALVLTHVTAQYPGNNPSEDRSVNIAGGDGPRMFAILDGHGGSLAVEHLRMTLLTQIAIELACDTTVASSLSLEQFVSDALKRAFVHCDETLKHSLLALPVETHLSKGYCNSGACAAVAVFVNDALFVANVGDCAVVLARSGATATARCTATQLTTDHDCSSADEVRLVLERSRDRNAIRLSRDDQANGSSCGTSYGIKRVAGSLAVTRAFGDFYLKCDALSTAPFKSKVPYITVEPSVAVHRLDGKEQFLILGSDGLWEVLTPDEAVQIVEMFDAAQSLFFASASAALIHAALEKIAHRDGLMLHEVMALPPGPVRRRLHDDITCTVVFLPHDRMDDDNIQDDGIETEVEGDETEAEIEPEASATVSPGRDGAASGATVHDDIVSNEVVSPSSGR